MRSNLHLDHEAVHKMLKRMVAELTGLPLLRNNCYDGASDGTNAAHIALAELEKNWTGNVLVVTKNIEDLHERGGTKNLIHMHGEVLRALRNLCGGKTN